MAALVARRRLFSSCAVTMSLLRSVRSVVTADCSSARDMPPTTCPASVRLGSTSGRVTRDAATARTRITTTPPTASNAVRRGGRDVGVCSDSSEEVTVCLDPLRRTDYAHQIVRPGFLAVADEYRGALFGRRL